VPVGKGDREEGGASRQRQLYLECLNRYLEGKGGGEVVRVEILGEVDGEAERWLGAGIGVVFAGDGLQ
jgi:hypothetical protein